MADYKNLHVWRKAHALSLNVHRSAIGIRGGTYAALRSQLIRAAMSVPTNIVEGRAQRSDREFARFLRHSAASSAELEYHLVTARDMGLLSAVASDALLKQSGDVSRMLRALIATLESAAATPPSPPESDHPPASKESAAPTMDLPPAG